METQVLDKLGYRFLGLPSGEKLLLQVRQYELTIQVSLPSPRGSVLDVSFQRFRLHLYETIGSGHHEISFA